MTDIDNDPNTKKAKIGLDMISIDINEKEKTILNQLSPRTKTSELELASPSLVNELDNSTYSSYPDNEDLALPNQI